MTREDEEQRLGIRREPPSVNRPETGERPATYEKDDRRRGRSRDLGGGPNGDGDGAVT